MAAGLLLPLCKLTSKQEMVMMQESDFIWFGVSLRTRACGARERS